MSRVAVVNAPVDQAKGEGLAGSPRQLWKPRVIRNIGGHEVIDANDALRDLRERCGNYNDFRFGNPADLGLKWVAPEGPQAMRGHFVATIEGKEMPVESTAIQTACRLLKVSPEYFDQFEDKTRFISDLVTLRGPSRRVVRGKAKQGEDEGGILVRTDGLRVHGILSPRFNVTPDSKIFEATLANLDDAKQNIFGVQMVREGWGKLNSYRILYGKPFEPMQQDMVYPMLDYSASEFGMFPSEVSLALWRLVCANGAMRQDHKQTLARWNHHGSDTGFYKGIRDVLERAERFSQRASNTLSEIAAKPLPFDMEPEAVIHQLVEQGELKRLHGEVCEKAAQQVSVETQYDLFNVFTHAAKSVPLAMRKSAESDSLKIFMRPGALEGVLASGAVAEEVGNKKAVEKFA